MAKKRAKKDAARLRELIEEATVDCYNQDEAHEGFLVSIEDNIVCPFQAKVIGEQVEVVELRRAALGFSVDAVCRYKGKDYRIGILSLDFPKDKPEGYEWIEAYQFWLSGGG